MIKPGLCAIIVFSLTLGTAAAEPAPVHHRDRQDDRAVQLCLHPLHGSLAKHPRGRREPILYMQQQEVTRWAR